MNYLYNCSNHEFAYEAIRAGLSHHYSIEGLGTIHLVWEQQIEDNYRPALGQCHGQLIGHGSTSHLVVNIRLGVKVYGRESQRFAIIHLENSDRVIAIKVGHNADDKYRLVAETLTKKRIGS